MLVLPIFDVIIVPQETLYFRTDYYEEVAGKPAEKAQDILFVLLKEDTDRQDLNTDTCYPIGVFGKVSEINVNGYVGIKTQGRVDIQSMMVDRYGNIEVESVPREDIIDTDPAREKERMDQMKARFIQYMSSFQWGNMARNYIMQWKSLGEIITILSRQMNLTTEEKYAITATDSVLERNQLMEKAIYEWMEMTRLSNEAESAQEQNDQKLYRESAIKKQSEFLQNQLDEMHPENVSDVRKFEKKIEELAMNRNAKEEARKVLNRMKQEGKNSSEYGLLYDYLDFVTNLAWDHPEAKEISLERAEQILDEDHFGLKKVKNRILQQIAVMNLKHQQSGSILLFVGAPGTGKTSIGQSIARALDRQYVRISLGGVRDEAEIRGHRRTYIGAMPGRIMDGIQKSHVSNPVVVLDEVDKLSRDYSGDPSSALLEVLDPEQNNTFTDHYMNVPYDLSNVLFICTANTTDSIPEPLLNRMEVIQFPGYTASDKFQITKKHLLPKAMKSMGIQAKNLRVPDETIRTIISDYTMEAGVRNLKKHMDTLCRQAAVVLVSKKQKSITVSPKRLREFLEAKPIRHDTSLKQTSPGIVTGLAWTRAGGEILFIETLFTKGKGKLIITGQLGDVMKESVQIAISLVKSMFPDKADLFDTNDLHVHVPEGAVPKDGPSAGITLTTALASLVMDKPIAGTIAMTGEVSLRGQVLPIGGLPEKLMAAQRAGIETVLIPKENKEDLDDVANEVLEKLHVIPVTDVKEVFRKTKVSL